MSGRSPDGVSLARTSDLLRNVLIARPHATSFTVAEILDAIGGERAEASLVFFSLPSIYPAQDLPPLGGISAGLVACQMTAGVKTVRLPKAILNRAVPRRSLAVAIHAIAPVIEAAEKIARPRLRWASCPMARRVLGLLVFVLAIAIAFPAIGFDPLHAAAISTISVGLAEQDGLAILLGVVTGLISLALIVSSGLTARLLKSRIARWLKKLARRAGARALAGVCERRGWTWLAAILRFEWTDLLTMWDPERRAAEKAARASARNAPVSTRRERPAQPAPDRRLRAGRASTLQPLAMA